MIERFPSRTERADKTQEGLERSIAEQERLLSGNVERLRAAEKAVGDRELTPEEKEEIQAKYASLQSDLNENVLKSPLIGISYGSLLALANSMTAPPELMLTRFVGTSTLATGVVVATLVLTSIIEKYRLRNKEMDELSRMHPRQS